MELNVVYAGMTENGTALKVGDVVKYRAHIPGGNVRIEFKDGKVDVAHPGCFKELR